jgi:hypothetical protein
MSTFDYSRAVATAKRLIARFGQDATLIQIANSGPAHNPTQVETDVSIKAAVFDYTLREREGSLIEQGDKKVYISTEGVPSISVADKIEFGSERQSIINLIPLSPGGTVVFYEAQVRA